jgi:hypothetical protein
MRKMRADSTWARLTPEQLDLLDEWLFEQRLGYATALARAEKEFGLRASLSSMGRYYRFCAAERQVMGLVKAQKAAMELNAVTADKDDLRTAAVKLVGKAALKVDAEQPEQVESLALLTNILLKSEENDIRRARVKLAEQQFRNEVSGNCKESDFSKVKAYVSAIANDDSLNEVEKLKRLTEYLHDFSAMFDLKVFGNKPDKSENGK